jgi:hypothetical protein
VVEFDDEAGVGRFAESDPVIRCLKKPNRRREPESGGGLVWPPMKAARHAAVLDSPPEGGVPSGAVGCSTLE